jgi:penicillin G amidase
MSGKIKKIIRIILVIFLFIITTGLLSFYIFFRLPVPDYNGTIKISGLKDEVEVRTDDHGIAHISAKNDEDLFFAQGYITARERMFQMDLTRLAGRGELSTLFGDKTIKTDKYFKTLGFHRAAEAEYKNLSQETKLAVDAYARGVNEYILTVKNLPREYIILGSKPQLWKPADSVVGALLMSYRLNAPRSIKPLLHQINVNSGPEILKKLLPWIPEAAPMISETKDVPAFSMDFNPEKSELEKIAVTTVENFYSPIPLRMRASNWMIFSGLRTTTGKPVFTGSPDLEAVIPSLFYLIHLKNKNYDVIGGSIAGLPGVHALGFNGKIAWSITVGNGDNTDFFTEKINPNNPDQYLTENGYINFTIIDDTIKIKSGKKLIEEKIKVKISRHGPVISAVMQGMPENCTMLWPGLMGKDGTMDGLLTLNRAKNFREFRKSLGMVRGASVHIGYADIDGNIGYQYMTTFPVRKSGENPVPVPGESGKHDWTGFVPYEKHPYAYNPKKGYLASFNQMPLKADYYGTAYFLFERPYRFEEMVKAKDKFSVKEIADMQNDTGSHTAKRFIPLISKACSKDDSLKPYISMLEKWDRFISIESHEATLFNSFITHLIKNTFEDQLGKNIVEELNKDLHVSIPLQWLIRYSSDPQNFFWDDIKTEKKETMDDMIHKSMKDAVAELRGKYGDDLKKWEWGRVHKMMIKHPLGSVLSFLNLGPYSYAGDDFTIHAGWWNRENPYEMISGAAIRIVVDMSDLSTMTLMSPPGQSGHFLSPHYGDLAETWSKGGQVPANYTSAMNLKNLLKLQPAK